MTRTAIVVGSGIVGASIAYHLARAGCVVTVVEADTPGGLATRNSFAWINASWGNPEFYFHFRRRSMAEWRRLGEEVPGLDLHICGGLLWDLPPDKLEAYAAEHERWGYGIRRVNRTQALAIEPRLKTPPDFALHIAEEGVVEPVPAARALLAAAEITVRKAKARAIVRGDGRVTGVETDDGRILADEVIVAAGVGSTALLTSIGVSLELDAPAGLIAHSRPIGAQLLNGLVLSPELHVRQTQEGRLIAGSDFAGADPDNRGQEMAEALIGGVRAMIRGAEHLELDFISVGHRPTPRDGFPLIGRPAGMPGLYLAVMHSGVTLAAGVGLLAALEIVEGERDPLLVPFSTDRNPIAMP